MTWRAIPKDVLGPWTVYYYPGEVVLTHLTKKSGGASYGSTWWNAKGDDIKAPESTELPETPGETFDAPKDPRTSIRYSRVVIAGLDRRSMSRVSIAMDARQVG